MSIPSLSIGGDYPPFVYLSNCIERLISVGIESIDRPLLPQPDVDIKAIQKAITSRNGRDNWIPDILIAQYSDKKIEEYISSFFHVVERAYTELVDSCFPLMKEDFYFYSTRPHCFVVCLVLGKPSAWQFTYGYRTSKSGAVETIFVNDDLWTTGSDKHGLLTYGSSSLDVVLENRHSSKPFVPGINTSKVNGRLIVRSWVYDLLKRDLEALQKKRTRDDREE